MAVVVAIWALIGFTTVSVLLLNEMSWQRSLPLVYSLMGLTRFCSPEKASWTRILD